MSTFWHHRRPIGKRGFAHSDGPGGMAPGQTLRHPLAIGAIALLIVNDQVLKSSMPGLLTGKLSDVAGLVFFPLFLAELAVLASGPLGRSMSTRRMLWIAIALTGVGFVLVKSTEVGGLLFAWSIGAAQWVVTIGFATGQAIRPVEIVVDPTDLVALPALALAAWIGHVRLGPSTSPPRRPRALVWRPRRAAGPGWVGVALVVLAGAGSLATSRSPIPPATSDVREPLNLTADRPVIARHVSWEVGDLQDEYGSVIFEVGAWPAGNDGSGENPSDQVVVSVIPDRPSDLSVDPELAQQTSHRWNLANCQTGCLGGATMIVRLAYGVEEVRDLDLLSRLTVYLSEDRKPTVALRADTDPSFDKPPTTLLAALEETVTVTDELLEHTSRAVLRVDASVLSDPLTFPLVGRVGAHLEVLDGATHPEAHEATFVVEPFGVRGGGWPIWFTAFTAQPDLDWLSECEPGRDCEVFLEMFSRYDPSLDGAVQSPASGFVELRWSIQARLESFDGRPLPDGAITLEMVDE